MTSTEPIPTLDALLTKVNNATDSTGRSITSSEVPLVIHRILERLFSRPDIETRIQEALDDIRFGTN